MYGNMDAIFGKTNPSGLFSSKNGILVSKFVEGHFDKGDCPRSSSKAVPGKCLDLAGKKAKGVQDRYHRQQLGIVRFQNHSNTSMTWRDLNHKRVEISHPLQENQ